MVILSTVAETVEYRTHLCQQLAKDIAWKLSRMPARDDYDAAFRLEEIAKLLHRAYDGLDVPEPAAPVGPEPF